MLSSKVSARIFTRFTNVRTAVDRGKRRALFRTAGLIATTAKRSMRMRANPSRPGTPPSAHTRGGLRQIRFFVDAHKDAALIGPLKFPGSRYFNEPVPHIHEFGGSYLTARGIWQYPERSFMNYTLRKLKASGKISKEFNVSIARVF